MCVGVVQYCCCGFTLEDGGPLATYDSANAQQGNLKQAKREIIGSLDARFPTLKFLSLGVYSAWILLTVTTPEMMSRLGATDPAHAMGELYMASGFALVVCLIAAGFLHRILQPHIEKGLFPLIGGALASLCTFPLAGGVGEISHSMFIACGIGTGIGTSLVCLRVGYITSLLTGSKVFFTVAECGLVSNFIFFMCKAAPAGSGAVLIAALPLVAVLFSLVSSKEQRSYLKDAGELISIDALPRLYFLRMMLAIFLFTLSVGVVKGLAFQEEASQLADSSTAEVFISFFVVAVLMAGVAVFLSQKNFEISKIYIPIGLVIVFGILLSPILNSGFLVIRGVIVNAAYNVFSLIIWCMLVELAGRTTLSSTRVFGIGRGMSGLGTTLGWTLVYSEQWLHIDAAQFYTAFFVVMAVLIVIVMVAVFDIRTINDAFESTVITHRSEPQDTKLIAKAAVPKEVGDVVPNPQEKSDAWKLACESITSDFMLTAREGEVYALLARGRAAGYIAEELGISYNTVKGYIKNVYAKADVHSRQELIDLTESYRDKIEHA